MRRLITIAIVFFCFQSLFGQNLQGYTPSILFGQGAWEFKSFQNLYVQSRSFGENGGIKKGDAGDNLYFFNSINQFLYGVNSQVNVGLDVWISHTSLPTGNGRDSQSGVTLIGPKVKVAPFQSISRLSIQTSYLFKTGEDFENRAPEATKRGFFFANDRSLWLTQFFYDKPINSKWQLFLQQAFWYNIVDDSFREKNFLQTQTSAFVNYFPNSRWTFYGMTEFFPTHYDANLQESSAFESYFVQSGLGTKYQLVPNKIELEALYTNFWLGSAFEGAGQTFNLGIRLVNQ